MCEQWVVAAGAIVVSKGGPNLPVGFATKSSKSGIFLRIVVREAHQG